MRNAVPVLQYTQNIIMKQAQLLSSCFPESPTQFSVFWDLLRDIYSFSGNVNFFVKLVGSQVTTPCHKTRGTTQWESWPAAATASFSLVSFPGHRRSATSVKNIPHLWYGYSFPCILYRAIGSKTRRHFVLQRMIQRISSNNHVSFSPVPLLYLVHL